MFVPWTMGMSARSAPSMRRTKRGSYQRPIHHPLVTTINWKATTTHIVLDLPRALRVREEELVGVVRDALHDGLERDVLRKRGRPRDGELAEGEDAGRVPKREAACDEAAPVVPEDDLYTPSSALRTQQTDAAWEGKGEKEGRGDAPPVLPRQSPAAQRGPR